MPERQTVKQRARNVSLRVASVAATTADYFQAEAIHGANALFPTHARRVLQGKTIPFFFSEAQIAGRINLLREPLGSSGNISHEQLYLMNSYMYLGLGIMLRLGIPPIIPNEMLSTLLSDVSFTISAPFLYGGISSRLLRRIQNTQHIIQAEGGEIKHRRLLRNVRYVPNPNRRS